jgi:hypothetical protein
MHIKSSYFYSLLGGGSVLSSFSSQSSQALEQKTTLVFFIGGCTYAEISALRFLSQAEESKHYKY